MIDSASLRRALRWLCSVVPLSLALAQQPAVVIRVLASGQDSGEQERFRSARSADELRAITQEESLAIDGTFDFSKETVVVLWYGDGRGGKPTVTVLFAGTGTGRDEPRRLLRIAGAIGAPRAKGRWVALALPAAWEPWRNHTWFETDATGVAGDAVWREVLPARAPLVLMPVEMIHADAGAAALCFADAAALGAFWHRFVPKRPVPPDYDFAQFVVLAVPEAPPSLYYLAGDEPGDARGAAGRRHRTVVRRWQSDAQQVKPPEPTFAWFLLPRLPGTVDFEVPVADSPGHHRVVASFPIAEPATSPKLQVLRAFECELGVQPTTRCERATTGAEWQALKKDLGSGAAQLPDDWCDFEHQCVVAVAIEHARMWPGLGLSVTEEEGVDVLTVTQTGPSGRDPGQRSSCVVLKLPRRKGQLSVVLRREVGPAPGSENTLRVFPGF